MISSPARLGYVASLVILASFASLPPALAGAQTKDRIANIAPPPPPPPVIIVQPGFQQFGGFVSSGFSAGFDGVPAVVLPDGRIFVNLGYGFEQVVRTCPSTNVVQTAVPQYVAPTQPVVVQPAPAQPTASEQMLATMRSPTATQTTQGFVATGQTSSSCWANRSGRVVVFRP